MKKMNIFKYAVFAAALSTGFISCSDDEFEQDTNSAQVVTVGGLNFQIGDYPSESLRSDVPGFREKDAKSAWAVNDEIKLILTCKYGENTMVYDVVLAYGEDGKWHNLSGNAVLETSSKNVLVNVSAVYGNVTLNKSGDGQSWEPQLTGTSEFLSFESFDNHANEAINIAFEKNYARLRLNVLPIENEDGDYEFEDVVVDFDGEFLANGSQPLPSVTIPAELIQANNKNGVYSGNAYIYGTWTEGTKILVGDRTFTLPTCERGKSYGVNLNPVQAPAVEVDAATNTITLAEYATVDDITMEVVMEALNGGTSLSVTGTITDESVYRAVFDALVDIAGDDESLIFDVDFSTVVGLSKLTAVAQYGPINSLKLPASLAEVAPGGIDAELMLDLYVYDSEIITYPKKGRTQKASFLNTLECTLHLPASAEAEYGDDVVWGNAEWADIVFDAE